MACDEKAAELQCQIGDVIQGLLGLGWSPDDVRDEVEAHLA